MKKNPPSVAGSPKRGCILVFSGEGAKALCDDWHSARTEDSMAQSWITEVSMEVEAEAPTTPAPPPPPPPPPDPAPPPAVPAPGVSYPAPAPATAQSPAPAVGAPAFYQDPYSSFSQYGAVQQYADPQVWN